MPSAACCANRCGISWRTPGRPTRRWRIPATSMLLQGSGRPWRGRGCPRSAPTMPRLGCVRSCWCSRNWDARPVRRRSSVRSRPIWRSRRSASNATRALLEDLHQGKAAVALALGAFDGDPAAGHVAMSGDTLARQAVVRRRRAGGDACPDLHRRARRRRRGRRRCARLDDAGHARPRGAAVLRTHVQNTPALCLDGLPPKLLADIALVARLACAGRALGAAQRAFDLAVEHAKVRKQFGQLIGQFQAVQHKLANCLISLDGARLALETAAEARDRGNPDWRVFAVVGARIRGSGAARRVDRDAPRARRHRLRRGARGAAAFPPRACRSRPLRRRRRARAPSLPISCSVRSQ